MIFNAIVFSFHSLFPDNRSLITVYFLLPSAAASCLLLSLFHAKPPSRKETHYSILITHYSFTNLLTIKSGVMSRETGVFLFLNVTPNS
jgi:hypothetical protein